MNVKLNDQMKMMFVELDALANTIQKCLTELNQLPDKEAKYYCGYTLMKYCAVHLGLDQIPLKNDFGI